MFTFCASGRSSESFNEGTIVIPKDVRKRFGLKPGKKLLVAVGKNEILLRKVEEIPLEDVSEKAYRVTRKEKVDIGALVDEAIRWTRRQNTPHNS